MDRLTTNSWLEKWGYTNARQGLHHNNVAPPTFHAYRNELKKLLDPGGLIQATAVYDVDGVPTVCFIQDDGQLTKNPAALDRIREKIWNQNLITIVIVVREKDALAVPVSKRGLKPEVLPRSKANETSVFSKRDVQSGEIYRRHTSWFAPENKVDSELLRNLHRIVEDLVDFGLNKIDAQYLMAQVLFVSYLEHRNIVGDTYRNKHGLGRLKNLVQAGNRAGMVQLLVQLKDDLNGDFLEPENEGSALWKKLSDIAFSRLNDFLERVDLETGQRSLWHYDFRFIPVELISGIYESFLSDERKEVGAYYTARHLANFVVDRALALSPDILAERIFDGACGSGILLTTAYRRMISHAEARKGDPLLFSERRDLLVNHIFGSDLSVAACRVTAFSLYLSMLENLQPADIAELQHNEKVKLPTLGQKNIFGGQNQGDFFSDNNPHAVSKKFTILLSNPPWVEPDKDQVSSDSWAKTRQLKIPRRNTAGAFMLRARDSLAPNGRICLILPTSIVAAPTSAKFLKTWLDFYQIETLINFGDLRKILFSSAKQPCIVAICKPRAKSSIGKIPNDENFEYWVPKADVSFAFGRLTLHSSDRHILQTQVVRQDSELLTSLFWGTAQDVATITELRLKGRLDDLISQNGFFRIRKGFHKKDATVERPVSSKPLRDMPFLNARQFVVDGPVLNPELLTDFPTQIETVASLPDDLIIAFNRPKIVFTDGITSHRRIRATFSKKKFSFSSSIGVISGSEKDESLLRFLAAYLHSSIAQYVLLLTAYQINFERERVTLKDVRRLPFIHPDQHPNPKRAWNIVNSVVKHTQELEGQFGFLRQPYDTREYDSLVFEYFGLNNSQKARILEAVQAIAPYLQPSSVLSLDTPLQRRPSKEQFNSYAKALHTEIHNWRQLRGGTGDITIKIRVNSKAIFGPLGIVRVEPAIKNRRNLKRTQTTINDKAVDQLLKLLIEDRLLPMEIQDNLHLATDVVIRTGETIYLIKPLLSRLWLRSEAYRDAERIVISVLSTGKNREVCQ